MSRNAARVRSGRAADTADHGTCERVRHRRRPVCDKASYASGCGLGGSSPDLFKREPMVELAGNDRREDRAHDTHDDLSPHGLPLPVIRVCSFRTGDSDAPTRCVDKFVHRRSENSRIDGVRLLRFLLLTPPPPMPPQARRRSVEEAGEARSVRRRAHIGPAQVVDDEGEGDRGEEVPQNGVRWERLATTRRGPADAILVTTALGGTSSIAGRLMRHGGEEYAYILEGELTLRLDFETYVLRLGDPLQVDSQPHMYSNHGSTLPRASGSSSWAAGSTTHRCPMPGRRGEPERSPASALDVVRVHRDGHRLGEAQGFQGQPRPRRVEHDRRRCDDVAGEPATVVEPQGGVRATEVRMTLPTWYAFAAGDTSTTHHAGSRPTVRSRPDRGLRRSPRTRRREPPGVRRA
jgi:hypothetical protein